MFATLTIQFPSSFTGGQLVLTHRGRKIVYPSGEDDASSPFSTFYTAFFADVEHEIRPVEAGYRLALVCNLKWIGTGTPPSAAQTSQLDVVANEIQNIAEDSPEEAWVLAFGTDHQYTMASLYKNGIGALKGRDRTKIGALISATKAANMGELEILLLMLSRTDMESVDGNQYTGFDVVHTEEGGVSIDHMFRADGSRCSLDLSFMDLEGTIKEGINFDLENEGQVEYTGNAGATRETTYGATCIVLWPKDKTVEVLSGSNKNLSFVLKHAKGNEQATADRLLGYLTDRESSPVDDSSVWRQLNAIFDFCLEHNLVHQTICAIQLAAEVTGPTGRFPVDVKLSQAVTKHGWKRISDAVQHFLCPVDISGMREIEARIKTLDRLRNEIPYQLQCDSVVTVFRFVQLKRSVVLWNSRTSDIDEKERARIWGLLFATLDSLHVDPRGKEHASTTTDLVARLRVICFQLEEKEVCAVESAMSARRVTQEPDPLHTVQSAINSRVSALRSKRFCSEVEYVVKNKTLPSSYVQYRKDARGVLKPMEDGNWPSFLLLMERVLSTEPVKPGCEKHFQLFLSALTSLSARTRRSMRSALSDRRRNLNTQEFRRQIMKSLQRADDLVAEKVLTQILKKLERATALPPENVQVMYPTNNFGDVPQIQSFLMSTKVETYITGYRSVIVARKVLKSFQNRLPHGIQSVAGGVGKNSYIHLRKPFGAERVKWLQHLSEKAALNKAQAELQTVQIRLGIIPEHSGKQSTAKKQKTNRTSGTIYPVEEEVSPTKVIQDVITID